MSVDQEYISLKLAFEPFTKFEEGQPIRILPQGTWYRGQRRLEITRGRLQEMANNFAMGLPRFRIPINLDHEKNGGKVGTINEIQYLPNGPKGPGLYATDYEFTPKGLAAIEENGYDAVSAEVVWTVGGKLGGMYQDPETGREFDNVLVGMALTPTPFFGHGNVALFSMHGETSMPETPFGGAKSFKEYELQREEEEERDRIGNLHDIFRMLFNNIWLDPFAGIDEKIESVDRLTSEFRKKITGGDEYSDEDNLAQEETMSEEILAAEELVDEHESEKTSVELSPEEFEALKAKAELAEKHEAEITRLENERKALEAEQRAESLKATAEGFAVLPVVIDEFVANMTALEDAAPEAAKWVRTQFAAFDEALKEAGITEELGTEQEGEEYDLLTETERILAAEFDGDRSRYDEALVKASAKNPARAEA